jgi:hypothetical protein
LSFSKVLASNLGRIYVDMASFKRRSFYLGDEENPVSIQQVIGMNCWAQVRSAYFGVEKFPTLASPPLGLN